MRPRIEITQEAGPVKRILVGIDGSAASRDALRWAARLAHAADSEVTAVHAFTPGTSELSPDYAEVLRSAAERRVEGWCAAAVGPGSVDRLVIDGGPDALLATAAEQADLLVVGTRGPGSLAHVHLGSVVHHLAHHTLVPLAIVPTSAAVHPVKRIVVGVDGSAGSAAAVAFCARLARLLTAAVVAVYADEPIVEWAAESDPCSWPPYAEAEVRRWVAPIEDSGVPVAVDVEWDVPAVATLCRAIEAAPDTLAIVGTRSLGDISGLRLSRVPIQLVHHTGAAVVMVPQDTRLSAAASGSEGLRAP
ncbi:MAG TPA: universal stress protein [Acidimicrobiia bacterium]|nr:universal stress protein [Acidimicrobiia bacterium]